MIGIFFDTETTGFSSAKNPCQIIQIGAVVEDCDTHRTLAELNIMVKPTIPISEGALKVHGITEKTANRYGVVQLEAERIFALLVQLADVVVAHNLKFDYDAVKGHWPVAASFIKRKAQYCTMVEGAKFEEIPKRHASSNKFPSLADSYFHFYGEEIQGAHDAITDARACQAVYHKHMGRQAA